MSRKFTALLLAAGLGLASATTAWAADAKDVATRLDAARTAWQKGDLARSSLELQQALAEVQARLGGVLTKQLPAAPQGWDAGDVEVQSLAGAGGGLSVARGYQKGDAVMNASVLLDNPAVAATQALFDNPALAAAQPQMKRIKLNNEDALLRWDTATRSGEVTLVLANRAMLQVEGSELTGQEQLLDLAKGWNVQGLRKTLALAP